jgi:hypothetical protein
MRKNIGKTAEPRTRVSIFFPKQLADKLRIEAARQNIPMCVLAVRVLEKKLNKVAV